MKIQEINRLEQEEKALFGFDLSEYIQNKAVQDAEDEWITPAAIEHMIVAFFSDIHKNSDAIVGKSAIKTLRLSSDVRKKLLDDTQLLKELNKNATYLQWVRYLKSNKPTIPITFDSQCAMDNRDVMFITQTHPLTVLSAKAVSNYLPATVNITVDSEIVPPGTYPYRLYSWNYIGFKYNRELIAISPEDSICQNIGMLLRNGSEIDAEPLDSDLKTELEQIHRHCWDSKRTKFIDDTKQIFEFRIKQLKQSYTIRERILQNKIISSTDSRITRMYSAQLSNLKLNLETQIREYLQLSTKTDIHTNLLLEGTIVVKRGEL